MQGIHKEPRNLIRQNYKILEKERDDEQKEQVRIDRIRTEAQDEFLRNQFIKKFEIEYKFGDSNPKIPDTENELKIVVDKYDTLKAIAQHYRVSTRTINRKLEKILGGTFTEVKASK